MGVHLRRLHKGWIRLPHLHRHGLLVLAVVVVALMSWPTEQSGLEASVYLPPELSHMDTFNGSFSPFSGTDRALRDHLQGSALPDVEGSEYTQIYHIQSGDSLSEIFDRTGMGQTVMYQILEADQSLLALDVLRAGHRLTFRTNPDTGRLDEMELYIHDGNRVSYRRVDDENFEYQEKIIEGDWPSRVISNEIHGSFYVSARNVGLSDREIAEISRLMEDQVDFSRDIRAGDVFEVVRSEQMVRGRSTGQTRIEAIRIHRNNRTHTAFLFEDGNYYDANGDSLVRAFMRYPMSNRYRISSHFNPSRRHPVTDRIAPHNGTDFAMPPGTPVLSTGDGRVTRVENHPFAGKYVEISHGSRYTTRYLHLNRILVRHGQEISRGQRIGLSGATGRVTGPHLHFELHVNGRPVNAMTAEIPMAEAVPDDRLEDFFEQVDHLLAVIENGSSRQVAGQ